MQSVFNRLHTNKKRLQLIINRFQGFAGYIFDFRKFPGRENKRSFNELLTKKRMP